MYGQNISVYFSDKFLCNAAINFCAFQRQIPVYFSNKFLGKANALTPVESTLGPILPEFQDPPPPAVLTRVCVRSCVGVLGWGLLNYFYVLPHTRNSPPVHSLPPFRPLFPPPPSSLPQFHHIQKSVVAGRRLSWGDRAGGPGGNLRDSAGLGAPGEGPGLLPGEPAHLLPRSGSPGEDSLLSLPRPLQTEGGSFTLGAPPFLRTCKAAAE